MAGDTAVAEPVNAEADLAAPEAVEELELLAETDESAETEAEAEAETETEESEPLSKAEVDKLLKAERAKMEESYRQKTENARKQAEDTARAEAYKVRLTGAERAQAGQVAQAIHAGMAQIAKEIEAGKEFGRDVNVSRQWLEGIANSASQAAFLTQWAASEEHFEAYVAHEAPDFKPPRELVSELRRAEAAQDPAGMFQARLKYQTAAIESKLEPVLRKKWETELKEKRKAAGTTEDLRNADATRRAAGRPTGVGDPGGTRRTYKTLQEADADLYSGRITSKQWQVATKGGSLPYS